jgi:chemotaxis protein CheD
MVFPSSMEVGGDRRTVAAAEMLASARADDVLVTYSLGSCIGLTLYDPVAKAGGLVHCLLPSSDIDPDRAKFKPYMFVDTAVPALVQKLCDMGGEARRMVAKVAGGAGPLEGRELFGIAVRNHKAVRDALRSASIRVDAEDIGGTAARTMSLHVASGLTTVKSGGPEVQL